MTTLKGLIRQPIHNPFRRVYIRRRNLSDGKYETDWQEITEFVKVYGSMKVAVDDVRLNRFTHSGITLKVRNDTGAFSNERFYSSLWKGYLTRYRTLVKVEAGYQDGRKTGYTEYPADPTMGIFIMSDEIPISAIRNDAAIKCKSIISIFDEVRAEDIGGIYTTQTASDILTKIRDHTDGSSNFVFQQFISTGAWNIQTTTNNYAIGTTTALEGESTWGLITALAEAEGFLTFVDRVGGLEFRDRLPKTSTVAYNFYGQGYPRQNVIQLMDYTEALNKHYNYFRIKYDEADTSTSYVTAGTTTSVDPSNTSWIYGSRKYEMENLFIPDDTTAQTVADNLFAEFEPLKEEVTITAKFVPNLDISDRVSLYYRTYNLGLATGDLWDQGDWDVSFFDDESGENISFLGDEFKILSMSTNLDKFTTTYRLREV